MNYSLWISFFSYTIVTAVSPGPNNILALNTVCNYGMKQSVRLLAGIYTGFLCIMLLCGLLGAMMEHALPHVLQYMKYIGFCYILWLAWHIAISSPPAEDATAGLEGEAVRREAVREETGEWPDQKWPDRKWAAAGGEGGREIKMQTSFLKGFLLQFANVKIIMAGLLIFTTYVLPNYTSQWAVIAFALIISLISTSATHLWAVAGAALSGLLRRYWKPFNLTMAVLLIFSSLGLLLD